MASVYLVDYWLPFPSSEYGGLQVIIAQDDTECIDLLLATVDKYDARQYPDYKKIITDKVKQASRIYLGAENEHCSEIVESFLT